MQRFGEKQEKKKKSHDFQRFMPTYIDKRCCECLKSSLDILKKRLSIIFAKLAGLEGKLEGIIVEARNDVNVVVHDLLASSSAIILKNVDSISTDSLLDSNGDLLGGDSNGAQNLIRNIENIGVAAL